MGAILTDKEIAAYQRDGAIIVDRPVLPPEKFAGLQQITGEKFEAAAIDVPDVQLIDCPHWTDPAMFDWIFADELLDLVEPLTGPNIAVFASHFLRKLPERCKRVSWHEDSSYWKGRLEPMEVVSVLIALSPTTRENGCLRVIPGSHRHGYSQYHDVDDQATEVFHSEIDADQFDESTAIDLVLEPNQASIHDSRIIHASDASSNPVTRICFAVRYISATVAYRGRVDEIFPTYLARGEDPAGNHRGDPAQTYPPSIFIV
ncbi:MAG: phytanoyl-CoA dioxygenase family protein [Lentisphaeria bacterium]|jgi:ectoine hydroxylase-related dioxygenase (phytanoyl-CoA dioxygenase family)|nr:phytanoyl-CoA dioxygenase family protein [Lentisphaeria bacterium]MDP7743798.1 phytanoyl-CoA dioxygenase family protein [Lentisphaeria bacterium]